MQLVGCAVPLFRPYVARLPWHGGTRAWLSKLFPRYGHYCGPNWSSGKEAGSVLWDRCPADHLDFCCYCHDMAYDTHDQAQLPWCGERSGTEASNGSVILVRKTEERVLFWQVDFH
jgi:hypothetical protein